jgi:hypothetical protein
MTMKKSMNCGVFLDTIGLTVAVFLGYLSVSISPPPNHVGMTMVVVYEDTLKLCERWCVTSL